MGFIVGCFDGYENISSNSKNMYNHICRIRKGFIMDRDAMETLSYLRGMADNDRLSL